MSTLFSGTENLILTDDDQSAIPVKRFVPGLEHTPPADGSGTRHASGGDILALARGAKYRLPALRADYRL